MSDTLTIRHDYEGGTTIEGTAKNSPAHHAIKATRSWVWSRYAGAWLLRSSRHRRPKYADIDLIEQVLTDLGYTVTRDIDETMPTVAEQEADRAERMDDRSNRLAERSEKQAGAAAATREKADAVFRNIPFGQPMLVGHHSYNADRNRREQAANNLTKSMKQGEYADELARRSDTAAAHMGARHNPVTVGNRIEKLEADRRAVQRQLDGEGAIESYTDEHGNPRERRVNRPPEGEARERLTTKATDLDDTLAYWRRIYAELQAEGKASTAGPDTVAKGDWVLIRGDWYRARRVNKKTVSVPSHLVNAPEQGRRESTNTAPWHEVREHRTTEQMPAAFVEAYETPGANRFRISSTQFVEAVARKSTPGERDSAG
ncbi:DUF3560 domain-containing protein [Saccharopolyspora sp. ID03-671]|uniref:DUF3560 domain-containing protein n=1 Tax=Saccharopolyspora sp. ID03-671 TaxID=3073066 RepID=UPI003255BD80